LGSTVKLRLPSSGSTEGRKASISERRADTAKVARRDEPMGPCRKRPPLMKETSANPPSWAEPRRVFTEMIPDEARPCSTPKPPGA
jgi:hypothetical protein